MDFNVLADHWLVETNLHALFERIRIAHAETNEYGCTISGILKKMEKFVLLEFLK